MKLTSYCTCVLDGPTSLSGKVTWCPVLESFSPLKIGSSCFFLMSLAKSEPVSRIVIRTLKFKEIQGRINTTVPCVFEFSDTGIFLISGKKKGICLVSFASNQILKIISHL